MTKYITIVGAATNNLKGIDLRIRRGEITALVGVSGAGKTSLAFDTIYAEGYLRYIESISPYIRQFLDKMEKPVVEDIDGLPPAIAFRHKKPAKNPRSIVATSMDVFDYLRILYAGISEFYCPGCGDHLRRYSIDEIITELLNPLDAESSVDKVYICFQYRGDAAFLINRGYYFYMEAGEKVRIDAAVKNKRIDVLIDTVTLQEENKGRLFEALDKSISFNNGEALVYFSGTGAGGSDLPCRVFSAQLYCLRCDERYEAADENLFSFNSPRGACPECKGFGDVQSPDPELIFDKEQSLSQGAVLPFNTPTTRRFKAGLLSHAFDRGISLETPLGRLGEEEIEFLMNGDRRYGGINGFFQRMQRKRYKVQNRAFLARYTSYRPCRRCNGARLNDTALSFRVAGKNLAEFLAMTIGEARRFMEGIDYETYKHKISAEVLNDILNRLRYLEQNGLFYLQLNRLSFTLSRGEYQRINLAFILGSTLSDSLLVIDQPSADLHPSDYEKLEGFFTHLKANGNTILVIEHNRDIVGYCDDVVELGPGSGEHGGKVMFSGTREAFFAGARVAEGSADAATDTRTVTQRYFAIPLESAPSALPMKEWFRFTDASTFNLKHFDFQFPRYGFTVITGVSGAGKTTLLYREIYEKCAAQGIPVVFIDPGLENVRANSIVAGYFDLYAPLRELVAQLQESRTLRYTPGHFSFNSALGRCDHCKGRGYVEIEMQFLPPVELRCNHCDASGFKPEVLKVRYKDKNIRELLDLSVEQSATLCGEDLSGKTRAMLANIMENGLGYLKMGQSLKTLSAGELQRIKLIKYLNRKQKNTLFLIDEPSFGLHAHDIEMVKRLFRRIIQRDNTIVAAEHNIQLTAFSDYLLELGPRGGEDGGYLVYQGKTADALEDPNSLTGAYLKKNKKKA